MFHENLNDCGWLLEIYLHFDDLGEGEFFDEVGEMTVEGWAGWNCTKYFKRGGMKKWGGETKILKEADIE